MGIPPRMSFTKLLLLLRDSMRVNKEQPAQSLLINVTLIAVL